jgi:hypothetical protein
MHSPLDLLHHHSIRDLPTEPRRQKSAGRGLSHVLVREPTSLHGRVPENALRFAECQSEVPKLFIPPSRHKTVRRVPS